MIAAAVRRHLIQVNNFPHLEPTIRRMEPRARFNLAYFALAVVALLLVQQWWQTAQTVEVLPYSEFEKLLAEGKIAEVAVSDARITGKLKTPEGRKSIAVANRVEPGLAERLSKYGVPYSQVRESTLLRDILS